MARVRSPNYPSLSLSAALERILRLYSEEGKNAMTREVMARHLGFGGVNGASATMISALGKYGLLETAGQGESRVSELAMRILFPHDASEKAAALKEAAEKPTLFSELKEKWPDRAPSDEGLKAYLVRKGFAPNALDTVVQIYRETIDVASMYEAVNGGGETEPRPETRMTGTTMITATPEKVAPPPARYESDGQQKPFTLAFDGSILTGTLALRSTRDIDRLVKVLKAQKAALEAMQDDEDMGEDPDDAVAKIGILD